MFTGIVITTVPFVRTLAADVKPAPTTTIEPVGTVPVPVTLIVTSTAVLLAGDVADATTETVGVVLATDDGMLTVAIFEATLVSPFWVNSA